MDIRSLTEALERAAVNPTRYLVPGEPPRPWTLPAEDYVVLTQCAGRLEVWGGREVVPGWEGLLRTYTSEDEACRDFYAELTRTDRPAFADAKAEWARRAARLRADAEEQLAREEPEQATERRRWTAEWRRRAERGEPLMSTQELADSLERISSDLRQAFWIAGIDPLREQTQERMVVEPAGPGWWHAGKWLHDRLWFVPEIELRSEGDVCAYAFDDATCHWSVPPELTLDQWRQYREHETDRVRLRRLWQDEPYPDSGTPSSTRVAEHVLLRDQSDESGYWIMGQERRQLRDDAWLLLHDSGSGLWFVEQNAQAEVTRRSFVSEADACAAFVLAVKG